jgi:excisionase family DNA binding protein
MVTSNDAPGSARYFTVKQVAERHQESEKTVRREIARGNLVAHRFGNSLRISPADLAAYERLRRGV